MRMHFEAVCETSARMRKTFILFWLFVGCGTWSGGPQAGDCCRPGRRGKDAVQRLIKGNCGVLVGQIHDKWKQCSLAQFEEPAYNSTVSIAWCCSVRTTTYVDAISRHTFRFERYAGAYPHHISEYHLGSYLQLLLSVIHHYGCHSCTSHAQLSITICNVRRRTMYYHR
jgi:hypothetical protein